MSAPPAVLAASLTGGDPWRTAPLLPFGLLASNATTSGVASDLGQGVLVGSGKSRGALLRQAFLLRDSEQPDLAWPSPRLTRAQQGRGVDPPALSFVPEQLHTRGFLATASLVGFPPDLRPRGVVAGSEAHSFHPSPGSLVQPWDVGGVIPMAPMRAGASPQVTTLSTNSLRNVGHTFGAGPGALSFMASREALRSGVISLQTQYTFPRQEPGWPEFAVLGHLTVPTRDKHPFLETEEPSVLALLMASQGVGWLTASMNLGGEWTPAGFAQHHVHYGAGLNAQVHSTLSLALDLLGRWTPMGDGFVDHMVELTLGARWTPFGALVLAATLQRSITHRESLGAGLTWTIRVDYTF